MLVCLTTLASAPPRASDVSERGTSARSELWSHRCLKRHSNSKPQRNRAAAATAKPCPTCALPQRKIQRAAEDTRCPKIKKTWRQDSAAGHTQEVWPQIKNKKGRNSGTARFWATALRVAEFVLASTLCCLRSPRFGSVLLIGVPLVSAARTPMQQTGDGGGNGLSIVVAVGAAASALAALRAAFAAKELEKKRVDREYDELKVRMFLPHDADDPLVRPCLSMYQRRTTTCRPTNKRR